MLLTELSPPPASGADRSDRRLLEHASEHPASIILDASVYLRFDTWRLLAYKFYGNH